MIGKKYYECKEVKMNCPMCGLGESYQKPDSENKGKKQCKGCGVKFHDKSMPMN